MPQLRGLPYTQEVEKASNWPRHSLPYFPIYMQLRGLPYSQVEKEISEGLRQLAACGIPAADIVGFRGPLLETDSSTRKALSKLGFLYDR